MKKHIYGKSDKQQQTHRNISTSSVELTMNLKRHDKHISGMISVLHSF